MRGVGDDDVPGERQRDADVAREHVAGRRADLRSDRLSRCDLVARRHVDRDVRRLLIALRLLRLERQRGGGLRHEELLRRERIPGQGQRGDDGCGERRQPEIPVHAPSFQICKWCAETMTPGQAMGCTTERPVS